MSTILFLTQLLPHEITGESVISKIDELLQSLSTTEEKPEETSQKSNLNRVHTGKSVESKSAVVILLGETYSSRREAFESLVTQVKMAMDDLSNAKERDELSSILDELYSFINSLYNEAPLAEFQNDFKNILAAVSKVGVADMSRAELVNILAQLAAKFEFIVAEELEKEAHDQKVEEVKSLFLKLSELGDDVREIWFMRQLASHAEEIVNVVDYSKYSE